MKAEHARSVVVLQQLLIQGVNIFLVIAKWCEKKALIPTTLTVKVCLKGGGKQSITRFFPFIIKLEKKSTLLFRVRTKNPKTCHMV